MQFLFVCHGASVCIYLEHLSENLNYLGLAGRSFS
jgi:hypothetical protein